MIARELFGKMPDGREVHSYTLTNLVGASVKVITLGATLVSLRIPNPRYKMTDVICGYDDIDSYLNNSGYQGAVIGRYGNRISNSSFVLDGKEYKLFNNEGNNHLHGGKEGFDKKIWDAKAWEAGNNIYLELSYLSKDMEEGYPGNLLVKVLYSFSSDCVLSINYRATTDKKTVVNLTNHAYFNLCGCGSGSIEKHLLWIDADRVSVVNEQLIPTGEDISVENTPFDFRVEKPIGQNIDDDNELLKLGQGYDHNFILNTNGNVKHIATLTDPISKRRVKVFTNQTCMQVYTANCIDESESPFKGGMKQKKRCAVCLETQHAPDSPNHDSFPSCELNPGEMYDYTTIFKFEY